VTRVLILSWEYPPLIEGGLARHVRKLAENLATHYSKPQVERILHVCLEQKVLEAMPVNEFLELWLEAAL